MADPEPAVQNDIRRLFELAKLPRYADVLLKCTQSIELRRQDLLEEEWDIFYEYMRHFTDADVLHLYNLLRANALYVNLSSLKHIHKRNETSHRVGGIRKIATIMQDPNYLIARDSPQLLIGQEVALAKARRVRKIYTNMVTAGITTPFIIAGVTGLPVRDITSWVNGTIDYRISEAIAELFSQMFEIDW